MKKQCKGAVFSFIFLSSYSRYTRKFICYEKNAAIYCKKNREVFCLSPCCWTNFWALTSKDRNRFRTSNSVFTCFCYVFEFPQDRLR